MILITEFMDQAAVDRLAAAHPTRYAPELADDQSAIPAALAGIKALIVRNRTQVTAELLAAAPELRIVGRLGVGLDNIDLEACKARGIAVMPATGANTLSVAEYVVTNALILLRNAYQAQEAMMAGAWPRAACSGREVAGRCLGLIGFGAIAQKTAELGRAMGMQIAAYDPLLPAEHPAWQGVRHCAELGDLLACADAVSLHVPLLPATRHMINAQSLAAMKPGAVLINAARGGVVDDAALAGALRAGRIAGAALDVFETEPLTAEAAGVFAGLSNLILTPHIAGVTQDSNERVSALIADRVLEGLAA